MKKLLLIISLLMPATIATGCKHNDTPTEEPIVEKPVINIPKNEIYAALEGGTYSISYTISNPIEDGKLEIGDIPEWIDNVNVTEDEIEVSVLANEKNINRSATMSASYTGAEKDASVKVFQDRVSKREDIFAMYTNSDIPYRIPAIAVTPTGRIICVADYRHSGADIGVVNNGRIDLHYRISDDNGESWGEVLTLIEGKGADSPDFMNVGYGDPCIVADRESNRVLVMSCAGNVSYPNGTRDNHQCIARFYSEDGGISWSEPEDIAESIYTQFDDSNNGPVRAMFIASGRIYQSRFVKVGSYYRLYCAALVKNVNGTPTNFALYSDDFGMSWTVLGGADRAPVSQYADEPKVEELPDGSLLISSRWEGGRYYNIFTYDDPVAATGSWGNKAFSGASNSGVKAQSNSTNGEVLVLPVTRLSDSAPMHLILQSVPLGPGRANVGIYYKELADENDYSTPANLAKNWDGVYQATELNSAYSTMALQSDNTIAFLFEETTHCEGNSGYGGYTIVYDNYSIEFLTNGKYSYREE